MPRTDGAGTTLKPAEAFRPRPSQREPPPNVLRDPALRRIVPFALVVGVVAGAAAFTVGSSRGVDALTASDALAAGAVVVLVGIIVLALAMLVWFRDARVAAAGIALVLGSVGGDLLAFQLLPGDTTDGGLRFALLDENGAYRLDGVHRATCTWERSTGTVVSVALRRPSGVGDGMLARLRLDLPSGALRLDRVDPPTGTTALSGEGVADLVLQDPTGRVGSGSVPELTSPRNPQQSAGARIEWSCPGLP